MRLNRRGGRLCRAGLVAGLGLLAGCAAGDAPDQVATATTTPAPATVAAAASATVYPLTIQNCGRLLTFDRAPARAVTYYHTTLEVLLALGLESRVIGRAPFAEAPVLPEQVAAFNGITELSTSFTAPPKEILFSQNPDFVFARLPSRELNPANGFATREEIEATGAEVYVMSAQCSPDTVGTLEDVFIDIANMGKIFDVNDRAAVLAKEYRAQLDAVKAKVGSKTPVAAVWYDSGEGPLTVYGKAVGSDLIARAGGANVFSTSAQQFPGVSVEDIALAKPDVWITNNYQPGSTADEKAAFLLNTFPDAPASQNARVVAIDNVEASPGIRNVATVTKLARAFFPEDFD